MALSIVPITQRDAKRFVSLYHRHNIPSIAAVFCLGLELDGVLVGAAMVGSPKSRSIAADRKVLEVTRACVHEGTRNANSKIYGACARIAKELGYKRLVTYTLESESGVSLRAAGWVLDEKPAGGGSWERHGGKGATDMFGNQRIPQGPKRRWWKEL